MKTDEHKKIEMYLNNNDLLFKNWHIKQVEFRTGIEYGKPVGYFDDYKNAFYYWVSDNTIILQEIICPNFDEIKRLKDPIDKITAIISLIEDISIIGAAVEVATALFVYGLEKLCVDENS